MTGVPPNDAVRALGGPVSAFSWASRHPGPGSQLHGGYAYLSDSGVEKIVGDRRVQQLLEGVNEIMRVIMARTLAEAPG